jgi:hypothetical protein
VYLLDLVVLQVLETGQTHESCLNTQMLLKLLASVTVEEVGCMNIIKSLVQES